MNLTEAEADELQRLKAFGAAFVRRKRNDNRRWKGSYELAIFAVPDTVALKFLAERGLVYEIMKVRGGKYVEYEYRMK